jgi:hypothetical protein
MTTRNFLIVVILFMVGLVVLFTKDSAFADAHKLNLLYLVVGISLVAGAIYKFIISL